MISRLQPRCGSTCPWRTRRTRLVHRRGTALHLENGPLEQLAEVALWLRSEVPPQQRLIFYDEGFNADLELHDDMSVEQLVERYLEADQA